ncbi:hypothetical protein NHX12_014876 [Muraenolepis orangiensis]|uniref:Uncharacterized protein n=1 Tax=Muraenolepis orangiensis TaxID=630683 RepID=A0A9Q0I5I2_9TELE|nr:hypothetical protein NHX12_014876 [Muraenolepis orangiensis]
MEAASFQRALISRGKFLEQHDPLTLSTNNQAVMAQIAQLTERVSILTSHRTPYFSTPQPNQLLLVFPLASPTAQILNISLETRISALFFYFSAHWYSSSGHIRPVQGTALPWLHHSRIAAPLTKLTSLQPPLSPGFRGLHRAEGSDHVTSS